MALNDYKITPTDEQGKLHTGKPQRINDEFQTYQEVQAFMDSYGQMVKIKHNGLIDEVGANLEEITDIQENKKVIYTSRKLLSKIGWYRIAKFSSVPCNGTININQRHSSGGGASIVANYSILTTAKADIIVTNNSNNSNPINKLRIAKDVNNNCFIELYYNLSVGNYVECVIDCAREDITTTVEAVDLIAVTDNPTSIKEVSLSDIGSGNLVTTEKSSWINATLVNGWTGTLQYRKNQLGQLEIKARALTPGTLANGTTISQFSEAHRPSEYSIITAYNSSTGKNMESPPFTLTDLAVLRVNISDLPSTAQLYFNVVCC